MKALLFLTVFSTGITLAGDWRTEENLDKAKPLAMNYFWKQPKRVNGQDVVDAVDKFTGDEFFTWEDERGFTFVHVLVQRSNNTRLLKFVLGFGNSFNPNKAGRSPRGYAQHQAKMKQVVERYCNQPWVSNFEDAASISSDTF